MQLDSDTLQWAWGLVVLPVTWAGKLLWNNHKSIQDIKQELAKNYPTFEDLDREAAEQREDLKYIRGKVDMLIQRELDKKD